MLSRVVQNNSPHVSFLNRKWIDYITKNYSVLVNSITCAEGNIYTRHNPSRYSRIPLHRAFNVKGNHSKSIPLHRVSYIKGNHSKSTDLDNEYLTAVQIVSE